jgi:hypothetical protein
MISERGRGKLRIGHPRVATVLHIAVLTGSLLGCGGRSAEEIHSPWTEERETQGDTLIVRTVSGSLWQDSMTLVPELAIGTLDGDEAFLFGAVGGLDVDPDGHIYVVDLQAQNVRVFSAEGEHLRTIGRGGEGPGEFNRPDVVRVTDDNRIIVRDAPWRFSVFSREGEYLGGWLLRSGFSTSTPFFLDAQGRVLNPTVPGSLVRYELHGTVVDTIQEPSRGYEAPRLEVTMSGGRASYSIPHMPSERWSMTRHGRFLFGLTSDYRIERWEPDGTVLKLERVVDPVPVSAGEASQAQERLTRTIRTANDPSWHWQGPGVPSEKPPWLSVQAGIDGSIWVFRSTVSVEQPDPSWDPQEPQEGFPTRWTAPRVADVFDARGRFLGPVNIPEELRLYPNPVLSAEYAWGVAIHELGYPQVIRYRLLPRTQTGRS